jgi:hypothetical protein
MWKDWQELGLVIILGMLLSSFVASIDRNSNGSIFENAKAPVPAKGTQATAKDDTPETPLALRYHGQSDNARRIVTYVYGPARKAQMVCGEDLRILRWKRDSHSVRMPGECWLMPAQDGVYTSSSPVLV